MAGKQGRKPNETLTTRRARFRGASSAALSVALVYSVPVAAQTLTSSQSITNSVRPQSGPASPSARTLTMQQSLARTYGPDGTLNRANAIRNYISQAQAAAISSVTRNVRDGLNHDGLDPVANAVVAAQDSVGNRTWQGASAPTQTTGANGAVTVTINQTDSRALLSWNNFDVGANTTLQFNQRLGTVAQPGWVAVNRVVASTAPSAILGKVVADGTVLVLNERGVIFGKNAQVNAHSLLASSLDIGNPVIGHAAATLAQRNAAFLQNGLLLPTNSNVLPNFLVSAQADPTVDQGSADLVGANTYTPVANREGDIIVEAGAKLTSSGGFLILTAPTISNAGNLVADGGQVSLQAGRAITATTSAGDALSVDPEVRGLILRTGATREGSVTNTGLVQANRGYVSLGAGSAGTVTNQGLIASTTSVSRNGKVSLTAGTVVLSGNSDAARAGGIVITPDTNGETIPLGTAQEPANFVSSSIEIGNVIYPGNGGYSRKGEGALVGKLGPGNVTLGENALIYAPSATVRIGANPNDLYDATQALPQVSVNLLAGATIDVSGVKAVEIDAARNSVKVDPVTRNELRDTPNYREPTTDGSFTLNGTTLYLDPRLSGVRDDGVAWVGSPLVDVAALFGQTPVTAAELMTRGGDISISVSLATTPSLPVPDNLSTINIARGAVLDFSGGWVHYNAGTIRSSKLLTRDGRVVDISQADPNDDFVAVGDGFTEIQAAFGVSTSFANQLLQGDRFQSAYDEGRDAGSLSIFAPTARVEGTLFGQAFAGPRQLLDAKVGTRRSGITGDVRHLQATGQQLPAAGLLTVSTRVASAITPGADIVVYHGSLGTAPTSTSETLLNDKLINDAGLAALTLETSGAVTFANAQTTTLQPAGALTVTGASDVKLAAGGGLTVNAGRTIRFDGQISVPSGTIAARTLELGGLNTSFSSGSAFRTDDDLPAFLAAGAAGPRPYDIVVTGLLNVAGRWINDAGKLGDAIDGPAWTDGGSITLQVAPKVFLPIGAEADLATDVADLSGSITIDPSARLNVNSGGYLSPARKFELDARGGNISLINETVYSRIALVESNGNNLLDPLRGSGPTVPVTKNNTPGEQSGGLLVPSQPRSTVTFSTESLSGFSFGGGGQFTLVSPEVTFGSTGPASSTIIPLDFIQRTGFGTVDFTVNHSRILPGGIFNNGVGGAAAFFDTTQFRIGAGETLNLNQTLFSAVPTTAEAIALTGLATDGSVASVLTPRIPVSPWDQRAANLGLHGLTELVIDQGGSIVGAPGATLTVSKLLNRGTITLRGGSIVQRQTLPFNLRVVGVRDTVPGSSDGLSEVFGGTTTNGLYSESASTNPDAQLLAPGGQRLLTNLEALTLLGSDRNILFVGEVDLSQGLVFATGSETDLSGTAVFNPRAPLIADSTGRVRQQVTGRLYDAGSISTAAANTSSASYFQPSEPGFNNYLDPVAGTSFQSFTAPRLLVAQAGSLIDLSGTTATFDEIVSRRAYGPVLEWTNGGALTAGSGGSITGATIRARGGTTSATGGTLTWLTPTLVQTTGQANAVNTLSADEISAAGFDSLIARRSITAGSDFTLNLRKAFLLEAAPISQIGGNDADVRVTVNAVPDAAGVGVTGTINAPYVRLASGVQRANADALIGAAGHSSVTFNAGAIDIVGGVAIGTNVGTANLNATGDLRLIGVTPRAIPGVLPVTLGGQLITTGDLTLTGNRIFATTGTGNLQLLLEDQNAARATTASPFLIGSTGTNATVRFARPAGATGTPASPLSAGTWLRIQAANVAQDGVLDAPFGRIDLGSAQPLSQTVDSSTFFLPSTRTLSFGTNSRTSVSGAGLDVPYGTTTDQIEYFFSPVVNGQLTVLPTGQLSLAGSTIDVGSGAIIDTTGGGALHAYEFVPGTGGSHDVLSQFNTDLFSGNAYTTDANGLVTGYQFPDQRQVYAIVKASDAAAIASFDPLFSANYQNGSGGGLYSANVGRTVFLDAAPGVEAGEYLLLPAQYATMPGALRLVENVGATVSSPDTTLRLRDGKIIVGGYYGTAGTELVDSTRRSFTVETPATVARFSTIAQTDAVTNLTRAADRIGGVLPRTLLDSARVVISPLTELRVAGEFRTAPPAGGRGSQIDITGTNILITGTPATAAGGQLVLDTGTLTNLNAGSLAIGAVRTDNADGTTGLRVTASTITVASSAELTVPEILLTVGGLNSGLTVANGAQLIATGTLSDPRTGDFLITTASSDRSIQFDETGAGSLLRVANGPERLVSRTVTSTARDRSTISLGSATLAGTSVAIDTVAPTITIANDINLQTTNLAYSAPTINFGPTGIQAPLEVKFGAIDHLTLRTPTVIQFANGVHSFRGLTLDAGGLGFLPGAGGQFDTGNVTINAGTLTFTNSGRDLGGCGAGVQFCGSARSVLTVNASEIDFAGGAFQTFGFDRSVTLNAANGAYYQGEGIFRSITGALNINTPFIADRSPIADPREQTVQTRLTIDTNAAVAIASAAGQQPAPAGNPGVGARLTIGSASTPALSVTIDGALLRATAGTVDTTATGNVTLTGNAVISAPGFTKTFGDSADRVTVSAGGGAITLQSVSGNIALGNATALISDTGIGNAGSINLLASRGGITTDGAINPGVVPATARDGSFSFDSATTAFDFASFVSTYGKRFGGDLNVRTGTGSMTLNAGQVYTARSVSLTADGGAITVLGKIDTSGAEGGDIGLFGQTGVTIGSGGVLDAHANGYADTDTRRATGGHVTLGIGGSDAALTLAAGATIDLGARRTGNRLVGTPGKDPVTLAAATDYRFIEADAGGTLTLRAPVVDRGAGNQVDIRTGGTVIGAGKQEVEGFRRFDLNAIARSNTYSGITAVGDTGVSLNAASVVAGKTNFLAGVDGPVVSFIQNFAVTAVDGSSLSGFTQRPGVEFNATGTIFLDSNWNLGAGAIRDIPAAVAAGYLRQSLIGPYADGSPRYEVVPGQEAALFQNYVDLLYRVGGRTSGAAPTITIRAGNELDIRNSITDGFFTFADASDPGYISYALGGGNQAVHPAITITCGSVNNSCDGLALFSESPIDTPRTEGVFFFPTRAVAGDVLPAGVPYNALANSAAALGGGVNGAGDPLGNAVLFPLLADGSAVDSSSYRLVGGTGGVLSANPLTVDRGARGSVTVEGEKSYSVQAVPGTARFASSLQFHYNGSAVDDKFNYSIEELLADINNNGAVGAGLLGGLSGDAFTSLVFGTGGSPLQADLRQAALNFFPADQFTDRQLSVVAPFSQMLEFFQSVQDDVANNIVSGAYGFGAPTTPRPIEYINNTVYVRSLVRTGTGSIDVAAARNVNLQGTQTPVLRTSSGAPADSRSNNGQQVGGTAVYTAGHVVNPTAVQARIAGTSQMATVTPTGYTFTDPAAANGQIPLPKQRYGVDATFASGGGGLTVTAGNDVLGRRDFWSENYLALGNSARGNRSFVPFGAIGTDTQQWRYGGVNEAGVGTQIGLLPNFFTSGIGALAGGDVSVRARGSVSDLIVALDTTVTSGTVGNNRAILTYGSGSLDLRAGNDLIAGRLDVAAGTGTVNVGGNVRGVTETSNLPAIRISDTVLSLTAAGGIRSQGVGALAAGGLATGTRPENNQRGFYAPVSSVSLVANQSITVAPGSIITTGTLDNQFNTSIGASILPGSFSAAALGGSLTLNRFSLTIPSAQSSINLLAAEDLTPLAFAQSDADIAFTPGAFSTDAAVGFLFPTSNSLTADGRLRIIHSDQITHVNDRDPSRVLVGGSINSSFLVFAEEARVVAGENIIDTSIVGQNLHSTDVTRIAAAGDITTTTRVNLLGQSFFRGNDILLGGPGTLSVEAGNDLGPFVTSALTDVQNVFNNVGLNARSPAPGGIRTVGNELNPWLGVDGANLNVLFGVGNGINYAGLRETYLNPANLGQLDGDLFEQNVDSSGNRTPDRTRPIYAPILAQWLLDNDPVAAAAILGTSQFDTPAALAAAAYGKFAELYTEFVGLDASRTNEQNQFLLNNVYFNELRSPADPNGNSFGQAIRGYRAVQTLFPTSLGYTDNLATYYTDPATVSADHPLGQPRKILANPFTNQPLTGADSKPLTDPALAPTFTDPVTGRQVSAAPLRATRVRTGNADLRLSTIQTARGGNITLIGPGGDFLAGSTVRTSEQIVRRSTAKEVGDPGPDDRRIYAVPAGAEGILTLRGGTIRSFTDGDFRVNQSRIYSANNANTGGTQLRGDIIMWSSNGDLNAGQGPRSSSSFPRVTVRFDPNGFSDINSAGSVSGAGIAALRQSPEAAAPDVVLLAPVGTVDAGDAGVRAAGNIIVVANAVANATGFKAGGSTVGVPTGAVVAAPAVPTSATAATNALASGVSQASRLGERASRITVDVLGYAGSDDTDCSKSENQGLPVCSNK